MITSNKVAEIEDNENLKPNELNNFYNEQKLVVGDLVYLPRGVMHRGVGNVLAQVITVPGFVPGAEIGVDHHLKNINLRLALNANRKLPYNEDASKEAIIK